MLDLASIGLSLLQDCIERQKNLEIIAQLSSRALAKEYGTIKLGSYRQAGHTTAALKIASKFQNVLIIVPRKGQLTRLLSRKELTGSSNVHAVSMETLQEHICGLMLDLIIVDGCATIPEASLNKIYSEVVLAAFACQRSPRYPLYLLLG
jgi:hypothetical protein